MTSSSASSTVAARISAFQSRSTTSFDSDRISRRTYPRKQRSLGSLVAQLDGANELIEARARLKQIGEIQKSPKKEKMDKQDQEPAAAIRQCKTNSSVLEELDDLLDTAIGEHATQFTTTESRETTDDATLDWPLPRTKSFISKSSSKHALRHSGAAAKRRQSRQRQQQADSSDSIELSTAAHAHAHGTSIDSERPRSSTDTDVGRHHPLLLEVEREAVRIEVPKRMQDGESPVKQRAALFENLAQHGAVMVHDVPHIHDVQNPTKIRGIWPPKQDVTAKEKTQYKFATSLEQHHLKFHHGRDEALAKNNADSQSRSLSPEKACATHVPPIPLALPQLVSSQRRPRPDVTGLRDSFTAASQTKASSVNIPVVPTSKSDEPKEGREASLNWPLRWDLLRKAPKLPIKESSIVARAEPEHHTSVEKLYETQHRVHDLLMAVQETAREPTPKQNIDQQDKQQSTPTRTPMSGALVETPRGSSATEKEVTSPSTATPARTVTPITPRGRHRLQNLEVSTHSPAGVKESSYKVDQRFALSRSRSRGGGVRVQVEIRPPKSSPARGGEHTVVVTTDVTPFDEQDEDVDDTT